MSIDLGLDDDAVALSGRWAACLTRRAVGAVRVTGADGVPLRFTGSFSAMTPALFPPLKWSCSGRHKSTTAVRTNRRTARPNRDRVLVLPAHDRRQREVIEIDVINMVMKVDGVDRLAEHRRAIGL